LRNLVDTLGASTLGSSPVYNVSLNYSGSGSPASARDMAKTLMVELEKLSRGRS